MKRDTGLGVWYRPSDKVIIDEVRGVYGPIPVTPDDVVLDLGAHIGATSALLLGKGAKRTIAIEADPTNISYLRRNLDRKRSTIIWAAAGNAVGRVRFYVRPDRSFLGSVIPDEGRQQITVPVLPLGGLLREYRPTILKCDIEFGEYDLPELHLLPDHVRVLAMEVHIRYSGVFEHRVQTPEELKDRREAAAHLLAAIEAQGFREVRRKDKQAKPGSLPKALEDDVALHPMTKAVDAVWTR